MAGCGDQASRPSEPPTTNQNAANPVAAVDAKSNATYKKLVGRWERPDGGYVLELRSVDAEGKFEAGYFNPSPIHIEQAAASTEQGATKLFILLRDANYPGCTYKLTYDPQADQLHGQYYQAAMQETYDVVFARLKETGP